MNPWTDIAIGNLQRRRGPPLDVDLCAADDEPLFRCKGPCGKLKPMDGFYQKHDARMGKYRRQSTCKVCVCERDKAAKTKHPRPPRKFPELLALLDTGPKTLRQLYEGLGISRRNTQDMIDKLVKAGDVYRSTTPQHIRNPRTPPMFARKPK